MSESGPPPGLVRIARIGRSHGLHGAMRVQPESPVAVVVLRASDSVWVEGFGDTDVGYVGTHGRDILLELDRVRRVETAKRLVHAGIFVEAAIVDEARRAFDTRDDDPNDPYRWIGRRVEVAPNDGGTTDGNATDLGVVEAVDGSSLQPLLRVRGPAGELLLPAFAPYVRLGDASIVLVDPPEGLLDPS